jgi:acetyltransferase
MKTTTIVPPSEIADTIPDFSGKPLRFNLDQSVVVKGLGTLKLRPIRLDDEKEMIEFHSHISEEGIYMRYFEYLGLDRRTSHERLVRICTNTPDCFALVVEKPGKRGGKDAIMGVARLTKASAPFVASFDTLVVDEAYLPRLSKLLLKRLIMLARAFRFHTLEGELLVADHDATNLCRDLGFSVRITPEDHLVHVTLNLIQGEHSTSSSNGSRIPI